MENISFQYPYWLISICVLTALVYAGMLYWRAKKLNERLPWLTSVLALLRAIPVLLITLLLLGPMLRQIIEESKRPTIAVLKDNSRSIQSWMTLNDATSVQSQIDDLSTALSSKYNVDQYSFGEAIRIQEDDTLDFTEDITNFSTALEYINDIYEGENLGAVILATDGIYNTGKNPLYASYASNIPIYGIALGDTTLRRDVLVQSVLYNEVAYLNDEMVTQVDIKAINASNQTIRLNVEKEGANGYVAVANRTIRVDSDDFFRTETITLSFEDVGIAHYRYRVTVINNEVNTANNRKDVYIEVLDARQEIGIIADAPHPDITALKQLLELNKNYEVQLFLEDPSASELSELDLVIFHQLPSINRNLNTLLATLNNQRTPRMYILGAKTNLARFNEIQSLVTIQGRNGSTNDAQGELLENFENFLISDRLKSSIGRYPPLSAPFGEYSSAGNVQTLLTQKIGDISTDFPLLSFADEDGLKTSYLFGTDIWRWKLFDFLQNENFDLISELIDKTIIYTSTKEDKRKFRVSTNNSVYLTNEEVIFNAELYNNSYELVNDAEVILRITSSDGNSYDYTFSRNSKAYALDIGRLTPGSYQYEAETIFNGEQYKAEGRFVVREIQYELFDLEAQHSLLYALSQSTNGSVFYPADIDRLKEQLLNQDQLKPIIYQNVVTKPFLELKWLFLLLIGPLFIEWVLRRYYGSL